MTTVNKFIGVLFLFSIFFLFRISSQVSAKEPREVYSKIDLNQMPFSNESLSLYESSNFYPGIKTDNGHRNYVLEFPTHNMVRVNIYEWALTLSNNCKPNSDSDYSNCIAKFKKSLESGRLYLKHLTNYNKTKILMVDVFRTPMWLSIDPDWTPGCYGGMVGEAYRPKDYKVWHQVLDVLVEYIKSIDAESQGTNIYYQFWNEPEQICNWKEGTAEFLQLYSQTAPYLKSIHPTSKVGGPGVTSWRGIIENDVNHRPQNLIFDLIQFTKEQKLPMDFVSFHYFSIDYRKDLIDGADNIRKFQKKMGIKEVNMPLIINEWLPQTETPYGYNSNQAVDGANMFLAMRDAGINAQGGVAWQDNGKAASEGWGIVTFDPVVKKPLFYVYKFFDELSRTSQGIYYWKENIDIEFRDTNSSFTVGERTFIISKEKKNKCYKVGSWNRLAPSDDVGIAYLLSKGIKVVDLQKEFDTELKEMKNKLVAAIKNYQSPIPKWAGLFKEAGFVKNEVDDIRNDQVFNYVLDFSPLKLLSASGKSYSQKDTYVMDKVILIDQNIMKFDLLSEEVFFADVCF